MAAPIDAGGAGGRPKRATFPVTRVAACVVPTIPAADASATPVEVDVAYGTADPDRQAYDVAWPNGAKLLVVILHGGGWTSGSRKLYAPTVRQLASAGYAAASVGYRFARETEHRFPVGLSDARCAVRRLMATAKTHGITKTVLLGASAGGHLAAMIALAGDAPGFDDECAEKGPIFVDGAVAYYPPIDLEHAAADYPPKMTQAVDELLREDAGPEAWLAAARAATPLHYVDRDDPPMLLVHGTADAIVPIEDSRKMLRALQNAGVPSLLVELPGEPHGYLLFGRGPSLLPATCSVLHFLESVAAN
ncbi:hypothetical protein BH09MYX1_BH09MYX1_23230 [soil metagenome]